MKGHIPLLFLVTLLLRTSEILACLCSPLPSPQKAFAEAQVVFIGKVLSMETATTAEDWVQVTFRVSRSWKGASNDKIIIHDLNHLRCAIGFEIDESYLVYGYNGPSPEIALRTDTCTRTRPLADAAEDLQALAGIEVFDK